MAERIQLKEPGSEFVMVVRSVTPEVIERNEYYLFGNGSKELLVPQSSVKGRFERLGIADVQAMVGQSVRFARSMKMSRAGAPYWDIDWAGGDVTTHIGSTGGDEGGKPTNTGTPASASPVDSTPRDEAIRREKAKHALALKQAVAYTLESIEPLYKAKDIGLSGDECYKHAYTIYQTWEDKGLIE